MGLGKGLCVEWPVYQVESGFDVNVYYYRIGHIFFSFLFLIRRTIQDLTDIMTEV